MGGFLRAFAAQSTAFTMENVARASWSYLILYLAVIGCSVPSLCAIMFAVWTGPSTVRSSFRPSVFSIRLGINLAGRKNRVLGKLVHGLRTGARAQ